MSKEKITINAAMEDDMFKMLEKWGFMGALENEDLKCPCGETITKENLAGIRPRKGKIVFYHHIICLTQDDNQTK